MYVYMHIKYENSWDMIIDIVKIYTNSKAYFIYLLAQY